MPTRRSWTPGTRSSSGPVCHCMRWRVSARIAFLSMMLLVAALVVQHGPQRVDAAPPPNGPTYALSSCSNQSMTAFPNTAFPENMAVCVLRMANFAHAPGIAVTFTATVGAGGASGTFANGTATVTVVSGANGMATATAFTANGKLGSYTVNVTANDATPNAFSLTNGDPTKPAVLSIGDGNNQAAKVQTDFAISLSVAVFNGSNQPIPNANVTFTVIAGPSGVGATFGPVNETATVATSATGLATAPTLHANAADGVFTVKVSIGTLTNSFSLRNTLFDPHGVPVIISVSAGGGQGADVGTDFPTDVQVVVLDGALTYVPNVTVTFKVVPGQTGSSGTFANHTGTTTAVTGQTGLATASTLTANNAAGFFTIHVTAGQVSTDISEHILAVDTTTTVSSSTFGISVFGQSVTYTADVAPANQVGTPTGPVIFKDGSTVIPGCGSVQLTNHQASCPVANPTMGVHSITVQYDGDDGFNPSTSSPFQQSVVTARTQVTLGSSTNPSTFQQSVTLTANVSVQAPGAGTPTGSVTFNEGTTALGAAVSLTNGQAKLQINTLSAGSHTIRAVYSGDTFFRTSTSTPIVQNVIVVPTKLAVVNYPSPSIAGTSHTVTVTATDNTGATATTYTGTVTLTTTDTQAVIGAPHTLTIGTGTFTVTFKTAGNQSITATGTTTAGGTLTGTQSGIVVQPAAPASLVTTGQSQFEALLGHAFSSPLVVTVKDAFGNPVPNIAVTFSGPTSGASATFSTNPATTDVQGVAQVTATANGTQGTYSVKAGAQGTTPATVTFTLTNSATLSSFAVTTISPSSGTTAGGDAVTLTGTGFAAGATVSIGGVACTNVQVVTSTTLTCTTGAHAAGTVDVAVTVGGTTKTLVGGYTYTAANTSPTLTLSAITPASGPIAGGATVTLTGTAFAAGATVSIGGAACTNVQIVTSTTLTCTTGAHAEGIVDVVITVGGGSTTLVGGYAYGVIPPQSRPNPAAGTPGSPIPPPGVHAPTTGTTGTTGGPAPVPPPLSRPADS